MLDTHQHKHNLCIVEGVCVCVCVCVFYSTFIHGVRAHSKTYVFIYEVRVAYLIKGSLLDAAFRCGRINA